MEFQAASGIDVASFLSLLEFYLRTTAVYLEGQMQKQGVCTVPSLAPLLSEIYLGVLDHEVHARVQSMTGACAIVKRMLFVCLYVYLRGRILKSWLIS